MFSFLSFSFSPFLPIRGNNVKRRDVLRNANRSEERRLLSLSVNKDNGVGGRAVSQGIGEKEPRVRGTTGGKTERTEPPPPVGGDDGATVRENERGE